MIKYAVDHPDEDQEVGEPKESETGGAAHEQQATADTSAAAETQQQVTAEQQAAAEASAVESSPKRALEGSPQPECVQKGRYDHAQFKKKATEDLREQAKLVRFDPETPITEPSSKALKTSFSSDVGTRAVQQVAELDLYVEDEPDAEYEEKGSYDWSEQQDQCESSNFLTQEDMKKRGCYDEGRGPPQVREEELQVLDQQAMLAEVSRLDDLQVLANVEPNDNIEEAVKLDTRIVFDWRFREACWIRRAWLVARSFVVEPHHLWRHSAPQVRFHSSNFLLSMSITNEVDGVRDGYFRCLFAGKAT